MPDGDLGQDSICHQTIISFGSDRKKKPTMIFIFDKNYLHCGQYPKAGDKLACAPAFSIYIESNTTTSQKILQCLCLLSV